MDKNNCSKIYPTNNDKTSPTTMTTTSSPQTKPGSQ